MKELKRILTEYEKLDLNTEKAAIATLVHINGSSYRRPGATMLLLYSGRWVGAISGGCLEGNVLRRAKEVMDTLEPQYVVYDTNDESNNPFGAKLGCNGTIEILIEPLTKENNPNPLDLIKQYESVDEEFVMALIYKASGALKGELGKRKIMFKDGRGQNKLSNPTLDHQSTEDIKEIHARRKSFIKQYDLPDGHVEIMYKLIQPRTRLLIFGGGMDVQPVVQIAKMLNWYVVVTDDCTGRMIIANGSGADEVIFCPREEILDEFQFNQHTAAVIMSHSIDYDQAVLKKLVQTEVPYIGLLGPHKRIHEMQESLHKEGFEIPDEALNNRIHSPIGLDIGGETPQEIALSITSEIQARFYNRNGGNLKLRTTPIHDRDEHEQLPLQIIR